MKELYTKLCPKCGSLQEYKEKRVLIQSIRKNKLCKFCSRKTSNVESLLKESIEAYYWIGFLLADAHFSPQNEMTLCISEKDILHLNKFIDFINYGNKVRSERNALCISVMDRINISLVKSKFNISNRKTYNESNISFIEDESLLKSLIIGFIDGDGYIGRSHNSKGVELKIKLHSSWIKNLELMSVVICGENKAKINNQGYAYLYIGKTKLLQNLYKFIENNKISVMERKWNIVKNTEFKT